MFILSQASFPFLTLKTQAPSYPNDSKQRSFFLSLSSPPIPLTSEMKVELSAQDLEQQSPHVTSDEPLIPPSLLPLAFDCSASCTARYRMSRRVCFLPKQHLFVASLRHRNYQVEDTLFCLCMQRSLGFDVFTLKWQ